MSQNYTHLPTPAECAQIGKNCCEQIATTNSLADLEKMRIQYLGRSGLITDLMAQLKASSLEEKKSSGPALNELKQTIYHAIESRRLQLETVANDAILEKDRDFDVTAYLPLQREGSLHPFTHLITRIENLFISMGYEPVAAPEVETDWFNFEALNIPSNHPARDMQDTFWLSTAPWLMRTHTSNAQSRVLLEKKPPYAGFCPGRVFRHEATDATHDFMFMQCEGFLVDKNVSLAHLCGTLKSFMQQLFNNPQIKIRLRPSYFPFVEPGVEVDISCIFCDSGCSICKRSTWIELGGAGMIHPHVLEAANIDPKIYRGFAFGFGIERLAMLLYGVKDIRLFRTPTVSFLKQFSR